MQGREKDDLELSDDFVAELKAALPPDSSAVLIVGDPDVVHELIGSVHADGVVSVLELHHPLSEALAEVLNEALAAGEGSTDV
jgi:alkanesulfonate monooxygenase SsuD/methylene tetrahydromethanopterin reductase-like flavin-dependent oxidoreductase (luciferase family)